MLTLLELTVNTVSQIQSNEKFGFGIGDIVIVAKSTGKRYLAAVKQKGMFARGQKVANPCV